MSTVRIITDSGAEIPPAEAAALQVDVLPLRYSLQGKVYRENVDMDSGPILAAISKAPGAATVLPPAAEDVSELLESVTRDGQESLVIHTAGGLVPIGHVLQATATNLVGRSRLEIIDSLAVSYGQRRLVQEAAKAAADGALLVEVAQMVRSMAARIYTLFYTKHFGPLESSVDIQPTQAILASILGVKPLVVLEQGRLLPLEKVTSRTTVVDKLTDYVLEFASVSELALLAGVVDSGVDLDELRTRIQQTLPELEIPVAALGPLVATLVGPQAMGVYVYEGRWASW